MAYAIISICFIRVEYFDNIFNFEFSAVYLRRELSVSSIKVGNWVSAILTVEIEAN